MGKRSSFVKSPRDYYRTFDPKAGKALAPYISNSPIYIEPFAGAGDLVTNLKNFAACDMMSDLEPQSPDIYQKDAFTYSDTELAEYECLITNPPWSREVLHKAIEFFTPKLPYCWWLIDGPWIFNKSSSWYLANYVTDIVSVGRLRWIEDTTMSSKDDCIWVRTAKKEPVDVISFHPRKECG